MPYAPLNASIYSAAYSGAMAQCVIRTGASATLSPPPDYTNYVAVADAWAQAVDVAWAGLPSTEFQDQAIETESETYHTTHPVRPADLAAASLPAYWTIPAAALVAAVNTATGPAGTHELELATPLTATFTEVAKSTWCDFQPINLRWVDEHYNVPPVQIVYHRWAWAGTITFAAGQMTDTHATNGGNARDDRICQGATINCCQASVSADLISATTGTQTYANFGVGICNSADFIAYQWEAISKTAFLHTFIGGVDTYLGTIAAVWTPPFTLVLLVVGNWVTVFYVKNAVWTNVYGANVSAYINLITANLTTWYGFIYQSTSCTNAGGVVTGVWDNFKVGRCGGNGIANMVPVMSEDGVTYLNGRRAYYVSTMAMTPSIGGGGIPGSSTAIFEVDLDKQTVAPISLLMQSRNGGIWPDTGCQLIRYDNTNYRVVWNTWANYAMPAPSTIEVWSGAVAGSSLLTPGTYVLSGASKLNLTQPGQGNYETALIKLNGTWYCCYSVLPSNTSLLPTFYSCLDSSPDLINWTSVGVWSGDVHFEGGKFWPKTNGNSYALTVGGITTFNGSGVVTYNRPVWYTYSLTTGAWLGALSALAPNASGHPGVISDGEYYYLFTFDQTTDGLAYGYWHLFKAPAWIAPASYAT